MPIARLHLITPDPLDAATVAATAVALAAGVRWVQVRVKAGSDRERLARTRDLVAVAHGYGATVVVNDRVDLALAAGADGVHLGLDDLPVPAARAVVPVDFIVGATVRNPDQARRKAGEGASYLGVGPVYATATKDGLPDPIGLDGLAVVAAAVPVPVIAISGITAARVADVRAAGAHGVAVVGAVYRQAEPAAAARGLLDALGVAGADDPGTVAVG